MTGKEIVEQIKAQRKENHAFIKWWRKEEDWIDYDLIDRFVATARDNEVIDGFELVGIDEIGEGLFRAVQPSLNLRIREDAEEFGADGIGEKQKNLFTAHQPYNQIGI